MSTATASKHHPSTIGRQSSSRVVLVGVDGSDETIEAARQARTVHEPVRALVGASGIVDLVVVGSRGLHA